MTGGRNWRLVRRLPELAHAPRRLRLDEPSDRPMRCDCDEPDDQPVGGWLPSSITACARCGRPL